MKGMLTICLELRISRKLLSKINKNIVKKLKMGFQKKTQLFNKPFFCFFQAEGVYINM